MLVRERVLRHQPGVRRQQLRSVLHCSTSTTSSKPEEKGDGFPSNQENLSCAQESISFSNQIFRLSCVDLSGVFPRSPSLMLGLVRYVTEDTLSGRIIISTSSFDKLLCVLSAGMETSHDLPLPRSQIEVDLLEKSAMFFLKCLWFPWVKKLQIFFFRVLGQISDSHLVTIRWRHFTDLWKRKVSRRLQSATYFSEIGSSLHESLSTSYVELVCTSVVDQPTRTLAFPRIQEKMKRRWISSPVAGFPNDSSELWPDLLWPGRF